ncbi:hypothetical protein LUS60_08805 [Raoultella planticola]|uniref:glycosyltransferase family 2 protein n=2 Tax=Raoultella planticola TaxID=575 RepID=UPI000D854250|nr:glycosyl transferase [Raoultella planticola]EKW1873649.1 hypothetical protein [Raoultella ornithinolytica]MDU4421697.1 hypothetical protein [Raoultella sp.]EKW3527209.1 hypothetical protein [Raoultella planticola]ELF4968470.1 hypothetical protein [Raoultella planticola]MCD9605388.1 hypothetical protein [Raoultella planticola]
MIGRIKVSAVVVLYKKQMLADSKTLASLEPYIGLLHNITIVNNGPDVLLEDESIYYKSENVAIIEHLKNRPLSSIYNDFIRTNDCDRFIILDDDTTITNSYIFNLVFNENKYDLGLPIIKSTHDNKSYYPVCSGVNNIRNEDVEYIHKKGSYSISSGMIISSELADYLFAIFGSIFDERFSLYGVDISLFRRIDKLIDRKEILIRSGVILEHDLSKFSNTISDFRKKELLIDLILQNNLYGSNRIKIFLKNIMFIIKGICFVDQGYFKQIMYSLIYKKHYRSEYK